MPLELTREQQQAVDASDGEPVAVVDPRTRRAFVLVPADRYQNGSPPREQAAATGRSQIAAEVPPGIRRSKEAFLRDLPALIRQKKRQRQWVAYHGDRRLGFAATETELYQRCFRKGLQEEEFYVGWIGPHPEEPEEVDVGLLEFTEIPEDKRDA